MSNNKYDPEVVAKNRQEFWKNIDNINPKWHADNSKQVIYRRELIANIMRDNNVKSVLELGCGSGVNLLYISRQCKDAQLAGIEINSKAIEYGKNIEKNPANIIHGSIYDLSQFKDNSFEVVFTCTVLIHIPSEKVGGIINEMTRIASKFVINIEDHKYFNKPYLYKGKEYSDGIPHRFETNYEELYKNTGHKFNIVDILDISKQTSGGANNIMWISKTSNELLLRDFR